MHCILDIVEFGRNGTPLLAKLLLGAVLDANIDKVARDVGLQAQYARLDTIPPDELRRPVSINALAASLHQPFETVRRHIRQLTEQGLCIAGPNGIYLPGGLLASPVFIALAVNRYQQVMRLQDDLHAAGVLGTAPVPLPPVDDPAAPARAVSRIYSDYFLRTIEILQRYVRDPVTGLVLLGVIRGGTEHVSHAEAAALMRAGAIPADQRTPVRVAQLSRRLAVPYETVRRHLAWLTEKGLCERCEGGFRLPVSFVARPEMAETLNDNLANLHRMFRRIEAVIAELDGPARRGLDRSS